MILLQKYLKIWYNVYGDRMRIYEVENYEELSKKCANIIVAQMLLNPKSVLGLATGSTPIGTYQILKEKFELGEIDFKN